MRRRIANRDARALCLNLMGLAQAPAGDGDPLAIIRQLGFVQLDSIQNVVRAHHHILWSRNQAYREPMFDRLLTQDRSIFEHFTHDASVLPMDFYPMWTRQFARLEAKVARYESYQRAKQDAAYEAIQRRIEAEGPLSTLAFDTKITGKKEMWDRPPHKRALDHMWYAGKLATAHRMNFVKFYDLRERVIPADLLATKYSDADQVDWLCRGALNRLGFALPGELQRFWGATSAAEVRSWLSENAAAVETVEVETATGAWVSCLAPAGLDAMLTQAKPPTSRLRIINPFDPIARDRDRLLRLFGFDYRIEIFVPPAKRKWGYYVYPLLEGDRFIGRIELKANRKSGVLEVRQLWAEPGIKWTNARMEKLDQELQRMALFAEAERVEWTCSQRGTVSA